MEFPGALSGLIDVKRSVLSSFVGVLLHTKAITQHTTKGRSKVLEDQQRRNSGNAKVARVKNTGTTQKIGPNMILKVMAGDSYNIRVASGWSSASAATNSNTSVVSSLLSLLTSSAAGASGGKATAAELQSAGSGLNSALTSFCKQPDNNRYKTESIY